jgi:predicted transcriptional regulator of viral defense system
LIDGANSPVWVGGIRHLSEMLNRYVATPSRNVARLTHVLDSHGRGAGAKRLGFVAENLEREARENEGKDFLRAVRELAMTRITKGVVKLDPAIHGRGRMNARWGLWVNADVSRSD